MARNSPSVDRVVAVLNFMAAHPDRAFKLTDILHALRLSRATCHSTLTSLADAGYLFRSADRTYMLGPVLAEIGKTAAAQYSPLQVAEPEMRQLSDEFDVVCSAFFLEGAQAVVRARTASVSHVSNATRLGSRLAMPPAAGALFLAFASDKAAESWLKAHPDGASAEARRSFQLRREAIREDGYLVLFRNGWDGAEPGMERLLEMEPTEAPAMLAGQLDDAARFDVVSILAPVRTSSGEAAFSLGMMGFDRSMQGTELRTIAGRLRQACDRIEASLLPR